MTSKANATYTWAWTHSHVHRISLNKVYVCCLYILFVLSSCFYSLFFMAQNQVKIWASSTETGLSDVLLHHHTATELLLLCRQTQLLHVRICAGGRAHAPHRWFGNGVEDALCCRLGMLLEASVGVRECLLADVQTSLKKVSSGGHGGQRGGVAGWGGWGAAGGGSLDGLLPGATHWSWLRRQGGGGVKDGGGSKHSSRRRRGRLMLGQEEQGIRCWSCLGGLDLRLGLVLNL